ncbi:MAG: DUF5658 family protein [Armatimonadota bacterium]|nr:DUF5658 family protein [Armatimonadota bacterium]MDR7532979.1 DUF5658 family protein [Armatimonadota bacterium]
MTLGSFAVLWRQFWALAAFQVADLWTTYRLLEGGGREGNVLMREVILTPMAPVVKALALVFLAALIVRSQRHGHPSPRRLAVAVWLVLGVYTVTIVNNLSIVLFP